MTEICNEAMREFVLALVSKYHSLIILTEGQEKEASSCWYSPGFKLYPQQNLPVVPRRATAFVFEVYTVVFRRQYLPL